MERGKHELGKTHRYGMELGWIFIKRHKLGRGNRAIDQNRDREREQEVGN